MGLRWLAVCLLVAGLAFEAAGEMRAAASAGQPIAEPLVPVLQPPPAALELLPPSVRPPAERARLAWVHRDRGAWQGSRWLEVVEHGDAERAWIEVEYTVDPELEQRIRDVLAARGVALGHVVVMDPASGEVFAYVSTDPVAFPATRAYPTASLMKLVTAAALLRNAPEAVERDCRYVGSPYRLRPDPLEAPSTGWIDPFWRAMAISNNQCFARLAMRDLGEQALLDEMRRAGLLESPAPRHPPGRVDPIDEPLDVGRLGSGLAGSFVTPLGAARLAALLADGELVRPWWIARIKDAQGDPLLAPGREEPRRVWPSEVVDALRANLVDVTENGTASRAFHDESGAPLLGDVAVAGKTGTLSGTNPEGRYRWFVGLAPADEPRVAIATVVVNDEAPGHGASEVAAAALHRVFCPEGACDPLHAERLHGRSLARVERIVEEGARAAQRELDRAPRPIGAPVLDFPRHLRDRRASGEIVLEIDLGADGSVQGARVDSSDLPAFDAFVLGQVRTWRFTPPTSRGRPVEARARLPIPIRIR